MRLFLCLLLLAVASTAARAQNGSVQPVNTTNGGPYSLRYDFSPGESVTYRVISFDSIAIWDAPPRIVIRERVEHVTYRCDSVLADGYAMTMVIEDAAATERIDTLPATTTTEHAWVGVPIRFVMSPTGERLRLRSYPELSGSTTGAPFQPLLIPPLGDSAATSVGARSVYDRDMWLLDNTYPPVQWSGAVMRVIAGAGDTLGHPTVAVTLGETGHVWYTPPVFPGTDTVSTLTRLNGGGTYWIDLKAGVPVAGSCQLIGDITFTNERTKQTLTGRHMMAVEYTIIDEEE